MDGRVEGGWRSATFDCTGLNIVVAGEDGFLVASSLDGRVILSNGTDILGPCSGPVSQCGVSNLFVIGQHSRCLLFDDSRRRAIGELGPYASSIVGLRWVEGAGVIVVQLEAGEVLVYDVQDDLRLVWRGPCAGTAGTAGTAGPEAIGTLAAVNVGGTARVAYAGRARGSVVVVQDPRAASPEEEVAEGNSQATIRAHNHDIAAVALSPDGCKLATASSHGTVIRIYRIATGSDKIAVSLEMELRRSSSSTARMHSLAFSFDSPPSLLACASDTGTLHVFRLAGGSSYSAIQSIQSIRSIQSIQSIRSTWRFDLPGKERCALAFHFRTPLTRPLLTVVSHSGAWQIGLLLEEDGAITLRTHLTNHLSER
jgi:WD40 repeat protein